MSWVVKSELPSTLRTNDRAPGGICLCRGDINSALGQQKLWFLVLFITKTQVSPLKENGMQHVHGTFLR